MMAPSPSKSTKTQHPSFIITADSVDTSPVPSSPPSTDAPKSQCSSLSDGESFECYGDNDISISENGGVDLELAPTLNSTPNGENNNINTNGITRHTWSRMSLRGAPKRYATCSFLPFQKHHHHVHSFSFPIHHHVPIRKHTLPKLPHSHVDAEVRFQ